MERCLVRWEGSFLCLCVDEKVNCTAEGWNVATVGFLVKDRLRYTTLHREFVDAGEKGEKEKKVQGQAFTSHLLPLVQALIFPSDERGHIRLLEAVGRVVRRIRPDLLWPQCVKTLNKDYAKGIEDARQVALPHSRPGNDFPHLLRRDGTLSKKCRVRALKGVSLYRCSSTG